MSLISSNTNSLDKWHSNRDPYITGTNETPFRETTRTRIIHGTFPEKPIYQLDSTFQSFSNLERETDPQFKILFPDNKIKKEPIIQENKTNDYDYKFEKRIKISNSNA